MLYSDTRITWKRETVIKDLLKLASFFKSDEPVAILTLNVKRQWQHQPGRQYCLPLDPYIENI